MKRAVKCSRKGLTDACTNGQYNEGGPYALQTQKHGGAPDSPWPFTG
jgi:hypothetical protein